MEQLHDSDPKSIGPYRVIARLGSGGMGRVYLCTSPGGRRLAVKVIRPELAEDDQFRARFRREVAAAQLVRSDVTAALVDADTESRTPWLATVFLEGPTLSAAVEQSPLAEPELRHLAAALAEALQYIHGAGLVHRDLKPSNIILGADGPMVIDFGIARAADATALTTTNLRIGSPGYMAAEQIIADASGPESDIFALGAVLAYAATGRSPFGSGPTDAVLFRVLHEEPNLNDVPPSLRALVAACLAKEPGRRPTPADILEGSMADPATLFLTEASSDEFAPSEPSRAPTSRVRVANTRLGTYIAPQSEELPRRSRGGVTALVVAAIAVLVAGTAWAAQPWRSAPSAPSSGFGASFSPIPSTMAVLSPSATSSSASSPSPNRATPRPRATSTHDRPRPQPATGTPDNSLWANLIDAPGYAQGAAPATITGAPGRGCTSSTGSVAGYTKVTCHTGHASTGLQRQGVLGIGNQWVLCQQNLRRTNPVFQQGQTNSWWFWTLSDNGIWDWFPETALKEGGSDNPVNGIPICNPGEGFAR